MVRVYFDMMFDVSAQAQAHVRMCVCVQTLCKYL